MTDQHNKGDREKLIVGMQPIVWMLAKKVSRPRGMDIWDLVQAGLVAVVRAYDLWDPGQSKFCTYAGTAAMRSMYKHVLKHQSVICLPMSQSKSFSSEMNLARQVATLTPRGKPGSQCGPTVTMDTDRIGDCIDGRELAEFAREVIGDRYLAILLDRMSGLTLREVGDKFGVSKERVSQIVKGAVQKLQEACGTVEIKAAG